MPHATVTSRGGSAGRGYDSTAIMRTWSRAKFYTVFVALVIAFTFFWRWIEADAHSH
jgi:hypothetical protein